MVARVSRLGGAGCDRAVGARNQTMARRWLRVSSTELDGDDGSAAVLLERGESESEAR